MEHKEINSVDYVREVTAKYIGPRRKSIAITLPADAVTFITSLLRDNAREHFIALYLNGASQIISHSLVSLGSANSAPVSPREVFQGAVLVGACRIIVGHNHPSGELTPSHEDRVITKRLYDAGQLLGISVIDHIIVSEAGFYSFQEHGDIMT
jgi:DNA repair protein RadC